MSPKRGDRVAPPPGPEEYEVIFGNNESVKGWEELCRQASTNTLDAWRSMRADPSPRSPSGRHHRLKGTRAMASYRGKLLPQWQIEVTSGGRIWYLVDEDGRRVVVMYAGTGHPSATD